MLKMVLNAEECILKRFELIALKFDCFDPFFRAKGNFEKYLQQPLKSLKIGAN